MIRQHLVRAALAAGALGLGVCGSAAAETEGFYFGISGGMAMVDIPSKAAFDEVFVPELQSFIAASGLTALSVSSSLDDSDAAWGLYAGYRFNKYVAAEFGYVNLGEALYEAIAQTTDGVVVFPVESSARFVTSGPTAALLGMFAINERFDVHGKVGLYFADTRVRNRIRDVEFFENVAHIEVDGGEQEVFLGIGGAWNINESYSVRLEYQRFLDVGDDATGESDIDMIAASILFR
jgi:OmpA-OmpF porin, OOP family